MGEAWKVRLRMTTSVLALAALASCLLAGPAAAAGWYPPLRLSESGQQAEEAHVATYGYGQAIAIWQRSNGSYDLVQASIRAADWRWSTPTTISEAGGDASAPRVGGDQSGNAVALWQLSEGPSSVIQTSESPKGGGWSKPQDLSAIGARATEPALAVSPDGNAVAVWRLADGGHFTIQAATRTTGGTWSQPTTIFEAGNYTTQPQIAIDRNGEATAVWDGYEGSHHTIQASTRTAGGTWSKPTTISEAGSDATQPQVAVDGNGDATAVWDGYEGSHHSVQASTRNAGGTWSQPTTISAASGSGTEPQVATDEEGDVTAVWTLLDEGSRIVQSSTRPVGEEWSAPQTLSEPADEADEPQVSVNAQGDATAIWKRVHAGNEAIEASVRTIEGAWCLSAIGQITSVAAEPQVAVGDRGVVAVWQQYTSEGAIAQAAFYDAPGPQLSALSIPATGTVFDPLVVSVSPLQTWARPEAPVWSFGDGGPTERGYARVVTYGRSGSHKITVTVKDVLGNTSSASRTVTIAPLPKQLRGHPGTALAAGAAYLRGGTVQLRLRCPGKQRCRGTLKLIVPRHGRHARRRGKHKATRGRRWVKLGRARFAVAAGRSSVIRIDLNREGRRRLRNAPNDRLEARLDGRGLYHRTVLIERR